LLLNKGYDLLEDFKHYENSLSSYSNQQIKDKSD